MASIKLNIYKKGNKKEIKKTYEVTSYDLMMGTLEDVIEAVDIDKVNNKVEFAKMIMSCLGKLKPIIFDIFPDLTEDEFKRIKVPELIPMFTSVIKAITEAMGVLNEGN